MNSSPFIYYILINRFNLASYLNSRILSSRIRSITSSITLYGTENHSLGLCLIPYLSATSRSTQTSPKLGELKIQTFVDSGCKFLSLTIDEPHPSDMLVHSLRY